MVGIQTERSNLGNYWYDFNNLLVLKKLDYKKSLTGIIYRLNIYKNLAEKIDITENYVIHLVFYTSAVLRCAAGNS